MRVFVTGATGALGSRLLPLLVAAGHSVPIVADGLDAEAIRTAVVFGEAMLTS
jgi:nucleoside-diphosphate-sugar epimerase